MADRLQLKAVVEADSSSDDDGDLQQPFDGSNSVPPEGLELGLSLGRWGRAVGSSSDGGRRDWLFPWDLAFGCAHSLGRDMLNGRREGVSSADPQASASGNTNSDWGRDFKSKRPKILAYAELSDYTAASFSGAEASVPPAISNTFPQQSSVPLPMEQEMVCPLSNNDCSRECREPNNGGDTDAGMSGTKNIEEEPEVKMDLTEDLLHLVFSFLGQKDLCKASITCKQWHTASIHEEFWRCLNFENTEISQTNFNAICRRYPNATEVNLFGVHNSNVLVMRAMTSLRRIETLILGKGHLGDSFFRALTSCHALKSLSICDASLGNNMQEITVYHDRLRELHIMKCRVLRVSIRCPQLQSLSLRRTTMAHAVLSCQQLHELDISSCHKLSDAAIRTAAMSCPLLASLDMSSCSAVSDETLREISFACPNLCVLDASYCPNISLESVRLPMLIDLKLHSCEGISSVSMSAISHSRMLEELQLDNCGLLTSVSLDLPHLREISLVHCRKFIELNLQSPMLSYIKVSNCSALHSINIASNSLKKLVLQKQERLDTLTLKCQNLQQVDLSDCESLRNSVCQVFSDGGGCPLLNSLVLDNCESLSVVALKSSSLVSLSLVGCHGVATLELSCPNLQKAKLDGCDRLESASFFPVDLESLNLGICPKLITLRIEAPKMAVLELKGCGVLSQSSINCPCLISLDASFCRQFVDDSLSTAAASCPRIETMILSSCLSIGFDGLSSLHWLRHLTLLDLSYTFLTNLKPVFDTCIHLVTLKLSACKYLSDSSLDALYREGALPALHELDLSYSSIGQTAIRELLAACTNLVNVNLNGCANMNDLVWDSSYFRPSDMPNSVGSSDPFPMEINKDALAKPDRSLEILNCIGSPNIKKVLIPSTARCFQLSKLNLNLSTNLKEVDIACINLGYMNLSNCISLEILKLDCPKLVNLQLMACCMLEGEMVEAAIAHCNMLEILNIHCCQKIHLEYQIRFRNVCPSLKRIHCSRPV